MGLPGISTSRPVTFFMVYIGIVAIGLVSAANLSIDLYPDISFPTVSVVTTYEGVAPEDIETVITKPIEEAVASVEDVDEVMPGRRRGFSGNRRFRSRLWIPPVPAIRSTRASFSDCSGDGRFPRSYALPTR